jgi:dTDP-4-dehydrorhamnose reductase
MITGQKKGLVLGATGMLGHVLFRWLSNDSNLDIYGTTRSKPPESAFPQELSGKIRYNVDAENFDSVRRAIDAVKPDFVINSIGMVDQAAIIKHPLAAISVNAQFPHQVSSLCRSSNARFVHISTDGIFDGRKGMYNEKDECNIKDAYGMTKYLGEVRNHGCLTLRTSIIGHGMKSKTGLVDWLLNQTNRVKGFSKAIYSGFPTIELARIISEFILPNEHLSGIYHVSSDPISKYDLLCLIAERYDVDIEIEPSEDMVTDRSLDSSAFRSLTGYSPPSWPKMIKRMHRDYIEHKESMYV